MLSINPSDTYIQNNNYHLRTMIFGNDICDLIALSSAEAPYGKFLNNIGFWRACRE